MTHPDTPELDEQIDNIFDTKLKVAAVNVQGVRGTRYVIQGQAEAKASLTRLLAKRELEGRIEELFNWEPLYDGDHTKCIDKLTCIGYENARSDFENEKELRLAELREELAKYNNPKEKI